MAVTRLACSFVASMALTIPVIVWTGASAAGGAFGTLAQATTSAPLVLQVAGRANANVSLAANGSFVAAVWTASMQTGMTDIYAAASRDGGATFSVPVRVNSTPGDARVNGEQPPRVALVGRGSGVPEITVIWTTKGSSGTRLLSASSRDGARTFSESKTVPGSDAAGNRGWESIAAGSGGRLFTAWLDHRKMAEPQQSSVAAEHHHDNGSGTPASGAQMNTAMSELSQLYVASLDGTVAARGITSGVCYCCKTAIATGAANTVYVAWRHVYADHLRDIAFTVSRDGGASFAAPVRVSEDHWQINGCPEDGPTLALDGRGAVHIVWPTVITENGGPVKALFHSMTRDGKTFTPRVRLPITAQANHPQMAIGPDGTLMIVWEESGNGPRRLGAAVGRMDHSEQMRFTRTADEASSGRYPVVVSIGPGAWLRAWTAGEGASSQIRVARSS